MRYGLILLSLVATPASAQALWQQVDYGMTAAQLRTLYPAGGHVSYANDEVVLGDYAVTDKCRGDVHIHLASGRVERVQVRGHGALGGHCADDVLDGLAAKYGQPLTEAPHRGSILRSEGIGYSWSHDGVKLRFTRFEAENVISLTTPSWTVDYGLANDRVAL